jgi:hypothetical protein
LRPVTLTRRYSFLAGRLLNRHRADLTLCGSCLTSFAAVLPCVGIAGFHCHSLRCSRATAQASPLATYLVATASHTAFSSADPLGASFVHRDGSFFLPRGKRGVLDDLCGGTLRSGHPKHRTGMLPVGGSPSPGRAHHGSPAGQAGRTKFDAHCRGQRAATTCVSSR